VNVYPKRGEARAGADPAYEVGRGLSVDQARTLLASRAERLHALYVIAVHLGLRRGELLGLRWQDVDLDRGTLEVRFTLQRVGGELQFLAAQDADIAPHGALATALPRCAAGSSCGAG